MHVHYNRICELTRQLQKLYPLPTGELISQRWANFENAY